MNQNRFLSPVVWSAATAQLLTLLVTLGIIDTGMSQAIEALIVTLLELLTVFGVLNNPTSKSSF